MQENQPNSTNLFNGFCPQCRLFGEEQAMQLNRDDFWQCNNCRLQLTTFPPFAAILAFRGASKYKMHVEYAHQYHNGLLLAAASREPGNEIFPDKNHLLSTCFELELYLSTVSNTHTEYLKGQCDPAAPNLKEQEAHLESISSDEWENVVEAFRKVKSDGIDSEAFLELHQLLHENGIIFPFNWRTWHKGHELIQNNSADFSTLSLLDVSMLLSLIWRSDRFDEGVIKRCYERGVLDNLFERLEQLT